MGGKSGEVYTRYLDYAVVIRTKEKYFEKYFFQMSENIESIVQAHRVISTSQNTPVFISILFVSEYLCQRG